MTRPLIDPSALISGSEAWDALLRDILAAVATTPFPVPQYANLASLPAAGSYDRCLACARCASRSSTGVPIATSP